LEAYFPLDRDGRLLKGTTAGLPVEADPILPQVEQTGDETDSADLVVGILAERDSETSGEDV
jgi:hypothetical protein